MSTLAAVPAQAAPSTTSLPRISLALGASILIALAIATVRGDSPHHSVFGTYWASGRAAAVGLNPYAVYPETYRSDFSSFHGPKAVADINLNPPCTLPFFQALAYLPLGAYRWVWSMGSVALLVLGAGLLLWQRPAMHPYQVLWLLAAAPVLNTIGAGQVYAVLFLLACLALFFSNNGKLTTAAIAIGLLIAVKPTMGLWLPFLWFAGHRRVSYRAAVATITASTFPVLFYGPRIYGQWIAAMHGDLHWMVTTDIAPIAFLTRHGHHTLGVALAVVITLALACWLWKKQPDLNRSNGIAACAGILCAPLAWTNYLLVIAPFLVARPWTRIAAIAAFALFIPTSLFSNAGAPAYLAVVAMMLWSFSQCREPH